MTWESETEGYLPISMIEKYVFCPRQAYLQYVEREDPDHEFLALGSLLHQRVQQGESETIGETQITRSMHVVSHHLRVYGIADVVEFHHGQPCPVEYKHGSGKKHKSQWLQLTLQAMCLEEMLAVSITQGAVFHGTSREREPVVIDESLRQQAQQTCAAAHACLSQQRRPPARWFRGCRNCSLIEVCLPKLPPTNPS